jgi:hypothetical protein
LDGEYGEVGAELSEAQRNRVTPPRFEVLDAARINL